MPLNPTFYLEQKPRDYRDGLQKEKARLERKVGQLVVEVDWLKKKCKELGIDP